MNLSTSFWTRASSMKTDILMCLSNTLKSAPEDVQIKITIYNRGPESLPSLLRLTHPLVSQHMDP